MDCQQCHGKKELMGLGLVTVTCPLCLGSGIKKNSEILPSALKKRRKTKPVMPATLLNEYTNEGINEETSPILQDTRNNTESSNGSGD